MARQTKPTPVKRGRSAAVVEMPEPKRRGGRRPGDTNAVLAARRAAKQAAEAPKRRTRAAAPAAEAPRRTRQPKAVVAEAPKRRGHQPKAEQAEKAYVLISKKDFARLMEDHAILQNRMSTASGELRETVADAVKRKHLHARAFADVAKLKRLGERDPGKLGEYLLHRDKYEEFAGIQKLAETQGSFLPAIEDDESGLVDEGESTNQEDMFADPEDAEHHDNVVGYPGRDVPESAGGFAA